MSILDKIALNVDYNQNFRKMSSWLNIGKYLDFGQNFRKTSILVDIDENLDLVKIDEISILVKIVGKS